MVNAYINPWFLTINCILQFASFIANFKSAIKVWKTFDTTKALYLLLLTDPLVGTICSASLVASFSAFIFYPQHAYTPIGCSSLFGFVFVNGNLGVLILFLISLVRLQLIRAKNFSKLSMQKCQLLVVIGVVLGSLICQITYIIVCFVFDIPYSVLTEICQYGPQNARNGHSLVAALFVVPNIVIIFATIIHDVATAIYIKTNTVQQSSRKIIKSSTDSKDLMELPIRSTLMSTMMSIPVLIIGATTLYASPTKEVKAYTIYTMYTIMNLFRSPVTVTSLFKSNEYNQALNREADRERRRQVVIDHAKKSRKLKLEQCQREFLQTISKMEQETTRSVHIQQMKAMNPESAIVTNPELTSVHI